MDILEKFMTGALVISLLVVSGSSYQEVKKAEQSRRNERQWAQERALIEDGRLERLYRVQCESLDNIPYVSIESNEADRLEKMWRLQLMQVSEYNTNSK